MAIRKLVSIVYDPEMENVNEEFKAKIFSELSHEIRTPLNSIMGFIQLLGKDNLTDAQKEMYVKHINDSSKELLSYTDSLLNKYKMKI